MNPETQKNIENHVHNNRVMLFMKGSKHFPQCGFSGQIVQILNGYGVQYETCDVLSDTEIRQGLKEFSDWPTFPQLYVGGEFLGGCDIVTEMHQNGQLREKLVETA